MCSCGGYTQRDAVGKETGGAWGWEVFVVAEIGGGWPCLGYVS
jgi:hypothetical protein